MHRYVTYQESLKDSKSMNGAEYGGMSVKDQFYPSTTSLPSAILNVSSNAEPLLPNTDYYMPPQKYMAT